MKKLPSWLLWVCGGLIVIGLIALAVAYWEWFSGGESGSTTLRNLGLMVAGVIALWFAYRRSCVADRQAETSHRGLLNERYQRGAEMLGSPVLSVRLGGIYALQHLAEDEPKQYHVLIMRLFCAFVRNPTRDDDIDHYDYEAEDKSVNYGLLIRKDVQAAMTAIGTRTEADVELEKKAKDTFELDLAGAHLSFAKLGGANLAGSNLSRAVWYDADLTHTDLTGANLSLSNALRQSQLDLACADSANPPKLEGVFDRTTSDSLEWRGKPCGK